MMYKTTALVLVIALLFFGFLRIFSRLKEVKGKLTFLAEFAENLKKYVISQGEDEEAYFWMIHRSNKMHSQIGTIGTIVYKPAFSLQAFSNYHVFPNALVELRRNFESGIRYTDETAKIIFTILVQYEGALDDEHESLISQLKNPLKWFQESVKTILLGPLLILSWVGIVSAGTITKVLRNALFKFVSGIVTIAAFLAAVIEIVVGFDQFSDVIRKLLSS